ncbi:hypothetical protein Q1695_004338 [Nippostrongylus brasiliensis]|nr:hypothetical protein Q1695_004338 [Nippostrongylus brasiliensis]
MVSVQVFFILASVLFISETVTATEQQEQTIEQPVTEELVVNITEANNKTITDLNESGALSNVLLAANAKLSELPSKTETKERREILRHALMSELRGLRLVTMSIYCKVTKSICEEARSRTAEAAVTLSKAIAEICPKYKDRIERIIKKPCTPPDYGVFRLSSVISVTNVC